MSESEIYQPLYAFSHTIHPNGDVQYDLYVDGIEIENYWIGKTSEDETWQSYYTINSQVRTNYHDFLSVAQFSIIEDYRINNGFDLNHPKDWITQQFLKTGFYLSEMKFRSARNGPPIAQLIHDGEVRSDFYLININHKNHEKPGMYETIVIRDNIIISATVYSIEDGLKVLIDEFEAKR